MKAIHRASYVIKVIGIVLILLSIVLGLYALINTGAARDMLGQGMDRFSAQDRWTDSLTFDRHFFSALSASTKNRFQKEDVRLDTAEPYFDGWFTRMEASARSQEEDVRLDFAKYLSFQTPETLKLNLLEEQQETRELREIFEYIDALAAPPKKGKLASMKAASKEPFFRDYYAAFSEDRPEENGTWFEFMSAVYHMLTAEQAAGSPVKDVEGWMNGTFTRENYLPALEAVRVEERSESADSFSAALSAVYAGNQSPDPQAFMAFFDQKAEKLQSLYPRDNLGGESASTLLVLALSDLMKDGSGFDGSYGAVADQMRTLASGDGEFAVTRFAPAGDGSADLTSRKMSTLLSVRNWEKTFLQKVLAEADNRKDIPVVSTFWRFVAVWVWILLAGITLIILSIVIRKLLYRHLLNNRDTKQVDDDPDVLLRVSHLKQYFRSGDYVNKAVDDISFFVKKGEVFGLVGESGCGKTTTGRTIINLYDPTEGDVYFEGLRISSNQNGLPVLKASLRQDFKAECSRLKSKLQEEKRLHPEQAAQLQAECERQVADLRRKLKEDLSRAEDNALESFVEKSKATRWYREKRKAELTQAYQEEITSLSGDEREKRTRRYRDEMKVAGKDNIMSRMQMIFQDPIASINPRMTVREIIAEGLVIQGVKDKEYINREVDRMLELVGLVPEHADRYPHEFSGGQRQRIGIARAIVMRPDLIIADEPISALDVSIQAQVINLLNELRDQMGLTIIFIAHNLSVVKYFSDRIGVMYFGKLVELASSDELFAHPLHPYTRALLSSIPLPDPHTEKTRRRITYNPLKDHDYSVEKPSLEEVLPGHFVMCSPSELAQYRKDLGIGD